MIWSELQGGLTGSIGQCTLQMTTALGMGSGETVSVHCSRPNTPSTEDWLSQNPDITPEHCGRGLTAFYHCLLTQPPLLPPTLCTTLSHFSSVKSTTSRPLRRLLHHLIFRSDLLTASVTSFQLAVLKSPKSLPGCHRNPAPFIWCLHGWSRRYKTFWLLSSATCAMRRFVVPFFSGNQTQTILAEEKYSWPWKSDILHINFKSFLHQWTSKVVERIVASRFVQHAKVNHLFPDTQLSYRQGHSTKIAMLLTLLGLCPTPPL